MVNKVGINIFISDVIKFAGHAEIGHCSMIGDAGVLQRNGAIGENAKIGRYSLIEGGINIGRNFELDDYCAVYSGTTIGNYVKLLYGKKIYGRSIIGDNCIIAGNIPERCILENNVTFMGEVAHSHYNPKKDWDTTDEPSPVIGAGSIIGVNALLIGGIKIGHNCYVSAGEILRHDLPNNKVFLKNKMYDIQHFKGLIKTRY